MARSKHERLYDHLTRMRRFNRYQIRDILDFCEDNPEYYDEALVSDAEEIAEMVGINNDDEED